MMIDGGSSFSFEIQKELKCYFTYAYWTEWVLKTQS